VRPLLEETLGRDVNPPGSPVPARGWARARRDRVPCVDGALTCIAPIRPLQLCADGGYQPSLGVLGVPLIMVLDKMPQEWPKDPCKNPRSSTIGEAKAQTQALDKQAKEKAALTDHPKSVPLCEDMADLSHPDLKDKARCVSYVRQGRTSHIMTKCIEINVINIINVIIT
jgi:hypothetical protein